MIETMKEAEHLDRVWLCERTGRLAVVADHPMLPAQLCSVHETEDCLAAYVREDVAEGRSRMGTEWERRTGQWVPLPGGMLGEIVPPEEGRPAVTVAADETGDPGPVHFGRIWWTFRVHAPWGFEEALVAPEAVAQASFDLVLATLEDLIRRATAKQLTRLGADVAEAMERAERAATRAP